MCGNEVKHPLPEPAPAPVVTPAAVPDEALDKASYEGLNVVVPNEALGDDKPDEPASPTLYHEAMTSFAREDNTGEA